MREKRNTGVQKRQVPTGAEEMPAAVLGHTYSRCPATKRKPGNVILRPVGGGTARKTVPPVGLDVTLGERTVSSPGTSKISSTGTPGWPFGKR